MSLFPVNRIFIRFHQIWREVGARLRNREWLFVFLILYEVTAMSFKTAGIVEDLHFFTQALHLGNSKLLLHKS